MKVLVSVLSCAHPLYLNILNNGCLRTWDSFELENMRTVYYFGGKETNIIKDKFITLSCDDSFHFIAEKTIKFFEYSLKNFDFDFLYRTNLSSYINKFRLYDFLKDKPKTNFYSSVICRYDKDKNFLFGSGAGFCLSRDLVEKLVSNKDKLDYSLCDDVCVGHGLQGVDLFPAERLTIQSLKGLECLENSEDNFAQYKLNLKPNLISKEKERDGIFIECNINKFDKSHLKKFISPFYHIRCKSESNRIEDIKIMQKIKELLHQ